MIQHTHRKKAKIIEKRQFVSRKNTTPATIIMKNLKNTTTQKYKKK